MKYITVPCREPKRYFVYASVRRPLVKGKSVTNEELFFRNCDRIRIKEVAAEEDGVYNGTTVMFF